MVIKITLTINTNSKKGKYFVRHILPKCKHMVTIRPSEALNGYTDYTMDIEDCRMSQELLKRWES